MVRNNPIIILLCSPVLLVLGVFLSIRYGAVELDLQDVWHAIVHYNPDNMTDVIIVTSRLPRALGAIMIGCLLAVSGALMQGVTRNYLASPSIMGVSDGSALFVTLAMIFFARSSVELIVFSFIGSLVAVFLVYGMASLVPNGMQPVRLAIIGIIIGTFCSSIAAGLAIYFKLSQSVSFWYNARLDKMDLTLVKMALPFALIGLVLAILLSKSVSIISMGEETAVSLGIKTTLVKCMAMVSVALMTGASVAIAGSIALVGFIVPHMVRFMVGTDYRWIIPCSGIMGGAVLCYADIASRFVNHPYETPIAIVISFIGIPFFIYMVHKKGGAQGV